MALPINITELINRRVVENARLSIKGIGIRNQFYIPSVHLLMTLITGAADILLLEWRKRMACRSFRSAGLLRIP